MSSKKLKEALIDLALVSTFHGIPNIARYFRLKSTFLTIAWSMSFIFFSVFFLVFTGQLIRQFFLFEVLTSIEIVNETPMLFPTVTFCNLNGKKVKYLINETLLDCQFNQINCDASDFKNFYVESFENCFRFNSLGDKMSDVAGKFNGLKIDLFSGVPDTEPDDEFSAGYGFHVYINNLTDNIDTRILSGVDVSPGFQTSLIVERIFYEKLTLPYDNCFSDLKSFYGFDSIYAKKVLDSGKIYQQTTCLEECKSELILKKCNCSQSTSGSFECLNIGADLDCARNIYFNFYTKEYRECLHYCPLECNTKEFKITTSSLM
jgi:hypothetical protein